MRKWGYLVFLLGWTLSMVYEWALRPGQAGLWAAAGLILDAVLAGAYLWERHKEKRGTALAPFTKGVYFAGAAVLGVLLVLAARSAPRQDPPHIMFLPMYAAGIAGALAAGFVLWRRERREPPGSKAESAGRENGSGGRPKGEDHDGIH